MTEQYESRQTNIVREAFASPLFLAFSILMSVATIVNYFNVFYILATIGMWIAFASAKSKDVKMKSSGIKLLSGTAKAFKIFSLVLSIIIIVSCLFTTIIFAASGNSISEKIDEKIITSNDSFADFVNSEYEKSCNRPLPEEIYKGLEEFDAIGISIGKLICIVIVCLSLAGLFVGIIYLVLALTFYRFLHKFIRSVCLYNENDGGIIEKATAVKIWLIVLGIFSAIGSITLAFANPLLLSVPAMLIVGYAWVGKYFC